MNKKEIKELQRMKFNYRNIQNLVGYYANKINSKTIGKLIETTLYVYNLIDFIGDKYYSIDVNIDYKDIYNWLNVEVPSSQDIDDLVIELNNNDIFIKRLTHLLGYFYENNKLCKDNELLKSLEYDEDLDVFDIRIDLNNVLTFDDIKNLLDVLKVRLIKFEVVSGEDVFKEV